MIALAGDEPSDIARELDRLLEGAGNQPIGISLVTTPPSAAHCGAMPVARGKPSPTGTHIRHQRLAELAAPWRGWLVDLGCGRGATLAHLLPYADSTVRLLGIDRDPRALESRSYM